MLKSEISNPLPPSQEGNGAGIDLKITVRDADGQIVNEQCKDGDIYLKNWALFIASMFKTAINTSYTESYKVHNTDGDTASISGIMGADNYNSNSSYAAYGWDNDARILVGSSTSDPSIDDYDIGSFIKEIQPNAPAMSNDGNIIKLTITGTESFDTSVTLSECAIRIRNPFGLNSSTFFCITRDTFTPVTVPSGGSVTLQFEFWYNGMPA